MSSIHMFLLVLLIFPAVGLFAWIVVKTGQSKINKCKKQCWKFEIVKQNKLKMVNDRVTYDIYACYNQYGVANWFSHRDRIVKGTLYESIPSDQLPAIESYIINECLPLLAGDKKDEIEITTSTKVLDVVLYKTSN